MHTPGRRLAALVAILIGVVLTATGQAVHASTAVVNVTINADEGLGTVPSTAYGLNQAVWDAQMNTTASVNLPSQAGIEKRWRANQR